MNAEIVAKPVFAFLQVDLEPGETIVAESDAMSSMAADLDVKAKLNGGFFSGLCKRFLGGESLFINEFTNNTGDTKRLTLTQNTPGDMHCLELENSSLCLQPGAYVCSTPGVKLGLKWAGIRSWIGREGLFKLEVSGTGKVWYGAYGGLIEKQIEGEYIIDTSHLVAYEPQLNMKVQLAGGIFSSFFSGEGLVTRMEGSGKIVIQTRSMESLASWTNRHLF